MLGRRRSPFCHTYLDPHIFQVSWVECSRLEGQVDLSGRSQCGCGGAERGRSGVALPNLNPGPGVCRPKNSQPGGLHGAWCFSRSCCLRTLSLVPSSIRDPLLRPFPARTWPEPRAPRLGIPSRRELPSGPFASASPLPPRPRPPGLPRAPWRDPGQTHEQPETSPQESPAWRLLGEMNRAAGISSGPKLPPKRLVVEESVRLGCEREVLSQPCLCLLFFLEPALFI